RRHVSHRGPAAAVRRSRRAKRRAPRSRVAPGRLPPLTSMAATTLDPTARIEPTWRQELRRVVLQEPLIWSRPSLEALRDPVPTRPRGILVGIGLCAREQLGRAVPIDLLGMLLPAEIVRRAVGEAPMLVLVADRHARENGLDEV